MEQEEEETQELNLMRKIMWNQVDFATSVDMSFQFNGRVFAVIVEIKDFDNYFFFKGFKLIYELYFDCINLVVLFYLSREKAITSNF